MNRALSAALVALALLAGCTAAKETCVSPSIRCGDQCIDGGSDPNNCGACGRVCGAGSSCCNSACTDVHGSDTLNCGACGQRCPVNGVCTTGTCSCPGALPTQCGTSPGTCVDPTLDPLNCGTCGQVCQGAGVAQADATCTSSACVCAGTAASTDCGGNPRCVNTSVDERNCGACASAGATHVCKTNAVCTGGACGCTNPAFPDSCPTACVNLRTDGSNCGSCGHACTGATSCSTGLCCPAGQTNCSSACVDTLTSATHCGACGHACAAGQACSGGACVCAGATPQACGGSCCGGTACCGAGSTTCQTAHSNGLGGTFFDCNPVYAPSQTTLAAARAAANAFGTGSDILGLCDGSCLARQNTSANTCAVWCYGLSAFAGHATSGATINCAGLCLDFQSGPTPVWQ